MAMAPDFPALFSFSGVFSRRRPVAKVETMSDEDRDAVCARRDFLNRMMCENASAVQSEHGMQAMMSMYPREF
ncbi:hypothetical protein [Boseongicola aestuarii]|jgi:hypothetical protein|uniref:Uncharacterized protein n=1 Tax=Boseongicola aestuarii TaxID=1470561 RepID=A0A238J2C5_9RHOB|nr:hypothetical protein [Boseongicola aestuarii]SMX24879.1 hypothetical protein BOA8489_03010 [Boseongicola aestuarii]